MDNMYRRRRYLQGVVRRAFSRGCCCALTPNNQRCLWSITLFSLRLLLVEEPVLPIHDIECWYAMIGREIRDFISRNRTHRMSTFQWSHFSLTAVSWEGFWWDGCSSQSSMNLHMKQYSCSIRLSRCMSSRTEKLMILFFPMRSCHSVPPYNSIS